MTNGIKTKCKESEAPTVTIDAGAIDNKVETKKSTIGFKQWRRKEKDEPKD